jgi:hypothetical protein
MEGLALFWICRSLSLQDNLAHWVPRGMPILSPWGVLKQHVLVLAAAAVVGQCSPK